MATEETSSAGPGPVAAPAADHQQHAPEEDHDSSLPRSSPELKPVEHHPVEPVESVERAADVSEKAAAAAEDAKAPAPPKQEVAHPRKDIPEWKWKCTLGVIFLTSILHGYDLSNVANIQPRLYKVFGDISLLPWISLSYSLAVFGVLSLSRKIVYCFDIRWIFISSMLVFAAGAAVAGSAHDMPTVIVGRVIMGAAGAVLQQVNLTYFAVFATPLETPGLFGMFSAWWATGLVIGGPIGSALAANSSATWRWAFYINLPFDGLAIVLAFLCMPSKSFAAPVPLWKRLVRADPLGIAFNMASPVLFCLALTFSGPIWAWSSGPAIAVWVVFAVAFVGWGVQQYFCIFTTAEERAFPLSILGRRDLLPIWLATACGGASYGITLYYTPLFFGFVHGYSQMQQTVRILPFILVFIVSVMMTGALLPALGRYWIIYVAAGVMALAGSAAMAATLSFDVSDAQVMGLEALIGFALGMHFQHGIGLCNVITKTHRDRVDAIVISNLSQYGAIAIILAVAGSIYQNVGFDLLSNALKGNHYTEHDIRAALAGVSSIVWQSRDPEVLHRGAVAVATVIGREFYIVTAAGALCLVCGLLMNREKLDYGRPKKAKKAKKAKKGAAEVADEPEEAKESGESA